MLAQAHTAWWGYGEAEDGEFLVEQINMTLSTYKKKCLSYLYFNTVLKCWFSDVGLGVVQWSFIFPKIKYNANCLNPKYCNEQCLENVRNHFYPIFHNLTYILIFNNIFLLIELEKEVLFYSVIALGH